MWSWTLTPLPSLKLLPYSNVMQYQGLLMEWFCFQETSQDGMGEGRHEEGRWQVWRFFQTWRTYPRTALWQAYSSVNPLAWPLPAGKLHAELFKSQQHLYKPNLLSFIWNLSRLIFPDLARQTITMLLRLILKSWAQVTPLSQPPK